MSLPGTSVVLNLFQVTQPVSASGLSLLCSLACLTTFSEAQLPSVWKRLSDLIVSSGREGPRESGHFQGLSEALLNSLPSQLKSFPAEWNVPISEETVT